LVKNKGLHYLLKALAITPGLKEKVHLDVVGEGADKSSFQKLAKKYELQNCVTFHGEIRGQNRIAYYQNSDIFCVPYQDEGLSLTLLEAMACGCSLVGFENQSFAEVLKDYPEPKCFAPQKKVEKLGEALLFSIKNPKKMAAVSTWNAKRAKKYSVQRMTNETLNVYSKVLD
jgi:glycosyltransferase involved in cell wall biosynthesis